MEDGKMGEGGRRATHMRASQTPAGRRAIQTSRSGASSAHLCRQSWTGGGAWGWRFARAEAEETNQNQAQTRTNQRRKQDEKMKKVQEKRGLVKSQRREAFLQAGSLRWRNRRNSELLLYLPRGSVRQSDVRLCFCIIHHGLFLIPNAAQRMSWGPSS